MIKIIDSAQRLAKWFGDLNIGDTFLCDGLLYIKTGQGEAINLSNSGIYEEFDASTWVTLVDIEIKVIRN